jgi:hypothetical protein
LGQCISKLLKEYFNYWITRSINADLKFLNYSFLFEIISEQFPVCDGKPLKGQRILLGLKT